MPKIILSKLSCWLPVILHTEHVLNSIEIWSKIPSKNKTQNQPEIKRIKIIEAHSNSVRLIPSFNYRSNQEKWVSKLAVS